jgi:hypothetical protein
MDSAAGAHLSGQQADYRQSSPLPEAKWLQELPLGVLEGERDGIDGRDRHSSPRQNLSAARYCELGGGANQFIGEGEHV